MPNPFWKTGEWPGAVPGWGTERVWADPTRETEANGLTFGRKDMAIHDGWWQGSAGCIDLAKHITDFANWEATLSCTSITLRLRRSLTLAGLRRHYARSRRLL